MRLFDLFSGCGGFACGFSRVYGESLHIIGHSDIDKYANAVYHNHYRDVKNYGNATGIDANSIPDFDILTAGFPCQSFSVAGRQEGFSDHRGILFFEIVRILKAKRPRYFLLENVKGLLGHESGKTFQTILKYFTECGYLCAWSVLNSKNFGVPQNRERIFIVGYSGSESRQEIFPIGQKEGWAFEIQREDRKKRLITHCINTRYGQRWVDESYIAQVQNDKYKVKSLFRGKHQQHHVYDKNGLGVALCQGRTDLNKIIADDDTKIRKLTPIECERLQGFPDNYTKFGNECGNEITISDTQRYKMLGNAVTVNVIEAIAKRFKEVNSP